MRKEGLEASDVGSEGEVAIADLNGAVWVGLVQAEVVLLDDGPAINCAFYDAWDR